jgi:hypothetical protein
MTMIDPFGSTVLGTRWALVALDVTFKATALMTLAFVCHRALGRRRALARSALWNACLIGLLVLPAASLAFPRLRVTVPTVRAASRFETAGPIPAVPPAAIASPEEVLPDSPRSIDRHAFGPFGTQPVAEPAPGRAVRSSINRPRSVPQLGGMDVAFGLYLAIATLLGIRLAGSLAAIVRLKRLCLPVEDARWAEALDSWWARLGITRRVPLLATERVSVPVVVGWLRPAIILPKALAGAANPGLIDAVLLHELGHVRRGDFGWNVLRKVVQLVYWPHPLVWLVGRVVGAVREQACDDLCVHALGGAGA